MAHQHRSILMCAVAVALLFPAALRAQSSATTQELIAVLQSDAAASEKAAACQRLAAIGDEAAVPALSALLWDERLAGPARSALEAVPGRTADDALLRAAKRLHGKLLVGVINSIGVRRDAGAVGTLRELARRSDTGVASAALAALGRIATPNATQTLLTTLASGLPDLRTAAADACLTCADQQLAMGREKEAARIYDAVRRAYVPEHIRLAATYGALIVEPSDGASLLAEQLQSGDTAAVRMALRAARRMPGHEVSEALADALAQAAPSFQVTLIQALAAREDKHAQAGIRAMAESETPEVRQAAVRALGPVDVATLEFRPLFDGRTFDGWEGDTAKSFRIEDGAIVGGNLQATIPRNEFLCTERSFTNFVLRLECKVVRANGGIQFRSQRVPEGAEVSGYQADMDSSGRYWGCLYDEARRGMLAEADAATTERIIKKDGWNAYEIRCDGPHIELFVNGVRTVDHIETDPAIPRSGIIAVQVHAGMPSETWYRDIEIAELP